MLEIEIVDVNDLTLERQKIVSFNFKYSDINGQTYLVEKDITLKIEIKLVNVHHFDTFVEAGLRMHILTGIDFSQ